MTVDDLVHKAIEEGRFGGLTLFLCSAGFQANLKLKSDGGWRSVTDADPIRALQRALGDAEQPAPTAAEQGSVFD